MSDKPELRASKAVAKRPKHASYYLQSVQAPRGSPVCALRIAHDDGPTRAVSDSN